MAVEDYYYIRHKGSHVKEAIVSTYVPNQEMCA